MSYPNPALPCSPQHNLMLPKPHLRAVSTGTERSCPSEGQCLLCHGHVVPVNGLQVGTITMLYSGFISWGIFFQYLVIVKCSLDKFLLTTMCLVWFTCSIKNLTPSHKNLTRNIISESVFTRFLSRKINLLHYRIGNLFMASFIEWLWVFFMCLGHHTWTSTANHIVCILFMRFE